jgi:hypothetical protein
MRSTALVIEEGRERLGRGWLFSSPIPRRPCSWTRSTLSSSLRIGTCSTAVLALIQVDIETILYLGLAAGVGRARCWFTRSTVRRRLEFVSGTVLVALGLRVASTSHRLR